VPGPDAADLPVRRGRTLAQVDGVRTAAQIATALACRTFHTLVELRRLAAAGLVTPVAPLVPVPTSAPAPASATATVFAEPGPSPRPAAPDEPDTALLRRLLHALEAL
jgi:hypothetical protein